MTTYNDEMPTAAPGYDGRYKAFVRDVDDPRTLGRVRVFCPAVSGGETDSADTWLDWALVDAGAFGGIAGQDYGASFVPAVGTPVWVECEQGDPEFPVVVGTWVQEGEGSSTPSLPKLARGETDPSTAAPTRTTEGVVVPAIPSGTSTYPHNRVIKTKAGHVIEIDETPGNVRIRVRHPSGTTEEITNVGDFVRQVVGDFLMWVGGQVKIAAVSDAVIAAGAVLYLGSGTAARKVPYADSLFATFNAHTHTVAGTAGTYPFTTQSGPPSSTMIDATHAVQKVRVP